MDNLRSMIQYLLKERGTTLKAEIPEDAAEQFRIYRSLVNVREPIPAAEEFLAAEDAFLQQMTAEKGITDVAELTPVEPQIYLWQGDITTLRCGAIVNAANSGMTGCWQPCRADRAGETERGALPVVGEQLPQLHGACS